jgi:hypothetical protein
MGERRSKCGKVMVLGIEEEMVGEQIDMGQKRSEFMLLRACYTRSTASVIVPAPRPSYSAYYELRVYASTCKPKKTDRILAK